MNKKIFGLICLSLICSSYSIRTSHMESSSELHDLSDLSEPIEADSEAKIAEENETIQPIEADEITQSIEEPEAVQPIEAGLFGIDNSPAPKESMQKQAPRKLNSAETRAAAFYPSGKTFREIYGDVGLSVQVEVARTLKNHNNVGIWGNVEWIFMDGKSRGRCGSSSVDMFDFSFGVKGIGYFFEDDLLLYAGIGPEVGLVYIENKIRCCSSCHKTKQHRSKVAVGGILKTGANVRVGSIFYLSLFGDYSYLPVHFSHTHNMGGGRVGGGLGARF